MGDQAVGVGLVGYGLGGSVFHAPLVQAEPGLRLHAVATSRAGQVQRDHPGVRVVATAGELLEDPAVELVVVAAPNAVHHQLARPHCGPAGTWSWTSRSRSPRPTPTS